MLVIFHCASLQEKRIEIIKNYVSKKYQDQVVDKSRQPAKYAGFSARFSPATFIASRARTEMMFIRSKLGLNKNINLHCLSFLTQG